LRGKAIKGWWLQEVLPYTRSYYLYHDILAIAIALNQNKNKNSYYLYHDILAIAIAIDQNKNIARKYNFLSKLQNDNSTYI
jgi:inosine-uridine nucleoside N-ribohydrolase